MEMEDPGKKVGALLGAIAIAVVGGAVGAGLVWGVAATFQFDLGSLLGTLAATTLAAILASRFGVLDRLRGQVRSDQMRRYVEGGFERLADDFTQDLNRAMDNSLLVDQLVHWSREGQYIDSERYASLKARLDPRSCGVPAGTMRVAALVNNDALYAYLAWNSGRIQVLQQEICVLLINELDNIRAADPSRREAALNRIAERLSRYQKMLVEIQGSVPAALLIMSRALTARLEKAEHLLESQIPRVLSKEIEAAVEALRLAAPRLLFPGERLPERLQIRDGGHEMGHSPETAAPNTSASC